MMTRYPDSSSQQDLGPNGAPDQSPKSPRYWLALVVIVALFIAALALLGHLS